MNTEDQTLELIRQYVKDSQAEQRREDPAAVIKLLQDRAVSVATLEKHFDTFTGQDRFWLYALADLLLEGEEARTQFYMARVPVERDPVCRRLVQLWRGHGR
jgi:hypothetical protein